MNNVYIKWQMCVITIDASLGQLGRACRAVRHDNVVCLSHVPLVNESCHTCVHESCHTHTHTHTWVYRALCQDVWMLVKKCVMFMCVPWRVHMCGMTRSYVCHNSSICVTWRIHMFDMSNSYVWHDSFICVTRHASFICVTWLLYIWMACSFMSATWLVHICDMTH